MNTVQKILIMISASGIAGIYDSILWSTFDILDFRYERKKLNTLAWLPSQLVQFWCAP